MAVVIVSGVAKQLIDIIKEQIENEIHLVTGVDEEVLNLADELNTLKYVLHDAENRRFQEKEINQWLSKLEQTSYEMEDILDEWNYALLKLKTKHHLSSPKHKVFSFVSCTRFEKVVVRHDIGKKIKNVKAKLDQILKKKDQYNFVTSMPTTDSLSQSWQVQSTSSIDSSNVHGRGRDRDILVAKLMYKQAGLRTHILSIVGMGGLGKTTLAQLVYNNCQVEKSFDLRVWIYVSKPFDLVAIAKGILESIEKNSSPNTNLLDVLFKHVEKSIMGKRFLLVLDDVWTEDHNKWIPLSNSLRYGNAGSKILVTTRSERVVNMMGLRENDMCRLGLLSNEDCWLMLRQFSFCGRDEVEFEAIGKNIAIKCNGLPLAAKTLGSLLRFKNSLEDWENVLNSEIWKIEKAEVDIFPHLLLSYNELSPTLKRCFLYCIIFPKGTEIVVENLIENWMALGYLDSHLGDIVLKGRECFDSLAMRSMFQDFERDYLDEKIIIRCKMHDVLYEFALFIMKSRRVESSKMYKTTCQTCDHELISTVNEFCSIFWYNELSPPNLCDCLTRLRVLGMKNSSLQSIPQGIENLIHLRWLDLSENKLSHTNLKIIFGLYYLQTLRLNCCYIEEIPAKIGNLFYLKQLELNNNCLKELPMKIGNLIQLRHLDLSYNESLKELPESICGLQELRTLVISHCKSLRRIPQGLAQLNFLHGLSEFRGGNGWNKFGLLKGLDNLSGVLVLKIKLSDGNLEEVVEDAREAKLSNKRFLKYLTIEFEDEMGENEESCNKIRMDLIDALEPHPNLETLCIMDYKGSKLPLNWMVSPLNRLRFIQLYDCNHLSSLPSLGKLSWLEEIAIVRMKGLESVGREILGIGGDVESSSNTFIAFPHLTKFSFYECPEWKVWEDMTAEEEEHATIMPFLKQLTISDCPALAKLPRFLVRKKQTLRMLLIPGSVKLQQYCKDNVVPFWLQQNERWLPKKKTRPC